MDDSTNRPGLPSNMVGSSIRPNVSNRTVDPCINQIYMPTYLHSSVAVAMGIIIILAMLDGKRTKNKCYFGIVVPVNFLEGYKNRWSVALVFGATTNTLATLLLGDFDGSWFDFKAPPYAFAALTMLAVAEVCVCFYPFFACLCTPFQFIGSILGFLYAAQWFAVQTQRTATCINPVPMLMPYVTLIVKLPELFCLFLLVVKFARHLYDAYSKRQFWIIDINANELATDHQKSHVRVLLQATQEEPPRLQSGGERILKALHDTLYKPLPSFRYSSRILSVMVITFSVGYQIGVLYIWLFPAIIRLVQDRIPQVVDHAIGTQNKTLPWSTHQAITRDIILSFLVAWYTATAITILVVFVYALDILRCYRTNLLRLYKGEHITLMGSRSSSSSAEIVSYSMKYGGYQIVYLIFGFLILQIVIFICGLLLAVIFVPVKYGQTKILIQVITTICVPLGTSFAMYYAQVLLARFIFLQDKLNEHDGDKPLAIKNRAWFHNANYFFFIFNMTLGVFACLARIGKGIFFGVLLLPRLDMPALMAGFEDYDKGYCAYLGMLYIEYSHNHPVLRVFAQLLLDDTKFGTKFDLAVGYQSERDLLCSQSQLHSGRVRRRWQIAYTLIKNPDLIRTRRGQCGHDMPKGQASCDDDTATPSCGSTLKLNVNHIQNHDRHNGDVKRDLAVP